MSLVHHTLRFAAATAILLAAGASPALADTGNPTPEPSSTAPTPGTYITYDATVNQTDFDGEGQSQAQPDRTARPTIRCEVGGTGCTLEGVYLAGKFEFAITGSTGVITEPNGGSVCNNDFKHGGTLTYAATATTFTATVHLDVTPHENCPSETWVWGSDVVYNGTFISGDACVLTGVPCPPTPTPTAVALAAGINSVDAIRLPSTPSVLSALPTPAQTLSPGQIATAIVLTVVLVILMAFPTQLLNRAVETGTDKVSEFMKRRRTKPVAEAPSSPKGRYPGLLPAALGVLAAGFISAFIDPHFGFDLASIRTFLSILVSFAIEVVLGWFVVIWLVRRVRPGTAATFRFAPLTLLIVVAAVLFTRLTQFQPGIVFGLVAGVSFGALLAAADKARVALVGLGYAFVLAILGWVGYSLLSLVADPGAAVVFVKESLASLAIGGIAALPITLIPLRGLSGFELWSWNKIVWGVGYAIGLLGFFLVLMPMPFAWGGVSVSLWTWVGLYLAYAIVSVALWLAITQPWKKEPAEPVVETPAEVVEASAE